MQLRRGKTAEQIDVLFGADSWGPREHCTRWEFWSPVAIYSIQDKTGEEVLRKYQAQTFQK